MSKHSIYKSNIERALDYILCGCLGFVIAMAIAIALI